jgi:uncharacterized protein involved in exopolysaccharide biosynthesis
LRWLHRGNPTSNIDSHLEPVSAPPQLTDPRPPTLDGADQLIRGVFEPPNSFALSAISHNKLIVFVVTLILGAAGVAFGLSRPRTYTASTTLQIGQVNPNSPGFYGFVQSASALATAFSRAIEAEPVLTTIQHKLKLPPAVALSKLSAEPIPQSPAFRVVATGRTQAAAIALANVTSAALIAYESKSNNSNPQAAALLKEYRSQNVALQRAIRRLDELNGDKAASSGDLASAEASRNAAAETLKATGLAYTQAVASQSPRSGLVSLLAGASVASGNRKSKVELYGLIGLLAGLVVGCAVAVLRERYRVSRSMRGHSVA